MTRSVLLLAWVLAVVQGSPAHAWVQATSSKGALLRWENPCIPIRINKYGTTQILGDMEIPSLRQALEAWNQPDCSNATLQFAGLTNYTVTGYVSESTPMNLIVFREEAWPYTETPVAFASLTYDPDTGIIVDADIEMNAVHHEFTTNPAAQPWRVDLQNVVTHELGHILGLDHSSEADSTMWWKTEHGETSKRDLHPDDIEGLCSIYPLQAFPVCTKVKPQDLDLIVEPSEPEPDNPEAGEPQAQSCHTTSTSGSNPRALWLLLGAVALLWVVRRARREAVRVRPLGWPLPCGLPCVASAKQGRGWGVVAVLAVLCWPGSALAWVQFTSSVGAPVAWGTSECEVGYVLDDSEIPGIPTEDLRQAIHGALAVWTALECGFVRLRFDGLVTNPRASALVGAMENAIVYVRTGWKHKSGDVAMTTLTYEPQTGRIRDADIELNLQGYSFTLCSEDPPEGNGGTSGIDIEYIIRHEAGHFFGLDHSTDPLSTMLVHPPYCHEKPPEFLGQDDIEGYCHIYGTDARKLACTATPEPIPEFIEDDDVVETPDTADPETPPARPRNCSHHGWNDDFAGLWPAGLLLLLAGWLIRRRLPRGEQCSLSGSAT